MPTSTGTIPVLELTIDKTLTTDFTMAAIDPEGDPITWTLVDVNAGANAAGLTLPSGPTSTSELAIDVVQVPHGASAVIAITISEGSAPWSVN